MPFKYHYIIVKGFIANRLVFFKNKSFSNDQRRFLKDKFLKEKKKMKKTIYGKSTLIHSMMNNKF